MKRRLRHPGERKRGVAGRIVQSQGQDNDNRKVGEAMEAITLVKVGGSGDHHQYCHIDKMTRSVPDRAVIGVFRLIGMGLGWPRDQMAGSVRRWRRH